MEYLMTYGWAILIIAVVLGVLFQMGVFSSSSLSVRAPPGACKVLRTSAAVNLVGQCSGLLPKYVAQFDGQSSEITINNNAAFASNQVTVAVWVKNTLGSGTAYDQLILSKSTSSYASYGYSLNWGWGDDFYWRAGNAGSNVDLIKTNLARGQGWYFIVATFQPGSQSLYVNGVLSGSNTLNFNIQYDASNLYIGDNPGSYRLQGYIADVQIYNTTLDASSVSTLYQEGMGGAPVSPQYLVGWWPLNGDAKDYGGNNNGVPTAMTFITQYGK